MSDSAATSSRKPQTDEEAREAMQRFMTNYAAASSPNNFDNPFSRSVTVISATLQTDNTPASATCSFTIPATYGNNPNGKTVHGGAIATFFDNVTSMPMLAVRNWWDGWTGVSRNLNVTYLRPPMVGEKVIVESEVVHCGRRIATIKGVLKRERDGAVLAICQHDKARPEGKEFFKL